eukprot:TRINITY_DN1337_c0_g1_i4.p1 TRINITY_DN1337_c0_g1~~TRINITY_DN1337_c0_g1_i4.p1  ORF type:complete len:205 (+),score=44.85 TRINITY_DN1337_c0_g1_i4:78-692(+)
MFRRVQRLRDERIASEALHSSFDGVFPASGNRELVHLGFAEQQPAANDRELARPAAYNHALVRPDPADRQRSITCEFLPGMYRPIRSDGRWTIWNPDLLPENVLPEQDLGGEPLEEEGDDDELLLTLESDDQEDIFGTQDVATTYASAFSDAAWENDSNTSEADYELRPSPGSEGMQPEQLNSERNRHKSSTKLLPPDAESEAR